MKDSPLGKKSEYPARYAPEVLYSIPRREAREAIGLGNGSLPFFGSDIWTAWELYWTNLQGKPVAAIATIEYPASSPAIVESKSLKLYLHSLSHQAFHDEMEVIATIRKDLQRCVSDEVNVALREPDGSDSAFAHYPESTLIDQYDLSVRSEQVDPDLLATESQPVENATLVSHLLKSLCPVTGQPDSGTLIINYSGPKINSPSLLNYLVSFHQHHDFHEACIERIFVDLQSHCKTEQLSVLGCYNRRGGIDINPFRCSENKTAKHLRLWRQ